MERRVLVTGAGSGFGLATAVHLADIGFTTIGLVASATEADALEKEAARKGVAVAQVRADLSEPAQRAKAVAGMELFGLVNNAGYLNAGLLQDVPIADARRQLETMVLAPLDLARRVLPAMLRQGSGRIVNVTSAATHVAVPTSGWYDASKAALRELTDALRVELKGSGVDVVDIEPGGFRTGIWRGAAQDLAARRSGSAKPEAYDKAREAIDRFEPKMGDPADVAEAIGRALVAGEPPAHIRVGRDAGPLRVIGDLLPDRIWDRIAPRAKAS